jgi:hypothetical protein
MAKQLTLHTGGRRGPAFVCDYGAARVGPPFRMPRFFEVFGGSRRRGIPSAANTDARYGFGIDSNGDMLASQLTHLLFK